MNTILIMCMAVGLAVLLGGAVIITLFASNFKIPYDG